jgi:hypothetical protein
MRAGGEGFWKGARQKGAAGLRAGQARLLSSSLRRGQSRQACDLPRQKQSAGLDGFVTTCRALALCVCAGVSAGGWARKQWMTKEHARDVFGH